MNKNVYRPALILPALVIITAGAFVFTGRAGSRGFFEPWQAAGQGQQEIQVPPPPLSDGIFPCSECHADMEPNPERRELEEFHDDIVLKHDEDNRWCMDCHDAENRDMLHTASGRLLDFKESYKLCGQCHGPKLRDWEAGIHGRRTGQWNGQKEYLLCAHCHNPHDPYYPRLKPEAAPMKPGAIK